MTELRRRMIQDMELHGLTDGTRQTYLEAIKNLSRHYNRPPDQLGEEEIREFFVYLIKARRLAPSTVRVYLYAIKFLFQKTLNRQWKALHLIRIKHKKKLPAILSPQEAKLLISRVRRPSARMALMMMYACGLRVSEATHLRAEDIDSGRMVVCVRNGKGGKDRYVPLPKNVLEKLREYWREHRPKMWLFPSQNEMVPLCPGSVRRTLNAAQRGSDITKRVSCHTLRHSYATHLLEKGVDIRVIQGLLGHRAIKSTLIYTHLTHATLKTASNTINDLMGDL